MQFDLDRGSLFEALVFFPQSVILDNILEIKSFGNDWNLGWCHTIYCVKTLLSVLFRGHCNWSFISLSLTAKLSEFRSFVFQNADVLLETKSMHYFTRLQFNIDVLGFFKNFFSKIIEHQISTIHCMAFIMMQQSMVIILTLWN